MLVTDVALTTYPMVPNPEIPTYGDYAPDVERIKPRLVQIGWINRQTGVMCDCPVYELSPHANSDPVYKEMP